MLLDFILQMSTYEIITQLVGIIACGIGTYAFFQRDGFQLRFWFAACIFLTSLHYAMLGAYTGAAAEFFGGVRTLVSITLLSRHFTPAFCFGYIISGLFTYETPTDLLAVGGGMLGTIAFLNFHKLKMRIIMVFATTMWIIYGVINGSIGVTIMESFFLIANVTMIVIILKNKKKEQIETVCK